MMNKKRNLAFLFFIILLINLVNCKSTINASSTGMSIKDKKSELKEIYYTYIIKFNKNNLEISKSKLDAKVINLLTGYAYGINFSLKNGVFKTKISETVSMLEKKSVVEFDEKNGEKYLVENGSYSFVKPEIIDYKRKFIVKVEGKGKNFDSIYNKLLLKAVRSKSKKNSNGIIIPYGDLKASLDENGIIKISEKFEIYIF